MVFYKTVTCGNDFLHIDAEELGTAAESLTAAGLPPVPRGHREKIDRGELARRLCHRLTGPGADGVVFYKIPPHSSEVDFEIFNRDGSEAELSGNGMAGCSAVLLYLNKLDDRDQVTLNTKAGIKRHSCLRREKNKFRLNVEIGPADFRDRDFFPFIDETPVSTPGDDSKDLPKAPVLRAYRYEDIAFYPVSVGNPHAVVLLEEALPLEQLEQMGKKLENAPLFPQKANVELVFPAGPSPLHPGEDSDEKGGNIRVFYYERGVGITQSSSTGSAAVYAVLQALNLITDSLAIPFPQGEIKISGKNKIYIESYTEIVYKGIFF